MWALERVQSTPFDLVPFQHIDNSTWSLDKAQIYDGGLTVTILLKTAEN
jgi:hypothetical protein